MSDPREYTVGWICAIPAEFAAARAFLDEQHPGPKAVAQNDNNTYALGTMGKHKVVIAVMPKKEYGIAAAATVARDMVHSFPNIFIGLMVGVGGGAPSQHHDIRLGDVVVSTREAANSGVIQFDYGKAIQNEGFVETGSLSHPPSALLNAVAGLETDYMMEGSELTNKVNRVLDQWKRLRKTHSRPPASTDQLYRSDFVHPCNSTAACSQECIPNIHNVVPRHKRGEEEDDPAVHYGLIASANQVMKNAEIRDKLSREKGVLCFEREAAGLMNHFPCLVVRGICDYSDTHKNKAWQGFAAMSAAAYAKDLLQKVSPDMIKAEKRIREVLETMEESLACIRSTTRGIKTQIVAMDSKTQHQKIKKWLAPPDTSTNYNQARESRRQGTGTWFLESKAFTEWKHGLRRQLWLYGMPGSGKTVLSTTILDDLTQTGDFVTVNFFFDFSNVDKQKPDDMCRSLAFQLYTKREESRKQLDSLLASHDDGQKQPTTQVLSQCLQEMMQTGKLCILLDALDECVKRTELLKWIQDFIFSPDLTCVQLIATSRPEEEFIRETRSWGGLSNCVWLEKEFVNVDIQSYMETRLATSKEFSRWVSTPSILQQIRDEVGRRADGMFRWAACQLDSLETCLDRQEIEAALKVLPQDLNATYDRILQSVPENRKKKTTRLLQFLVYSERPLALHEAVDVMAVRLEDGRYFDPRDRLPNPTDITRFCPSLVVLVQRSDTPVVDAFLQLAHFTVKKYLMSSANEGFYGVEPRISITQTCLVYLTSVEEDQVSKMRDRFPLARHAAEIWMEHAEVAESSDETVATIVGFLQSQKDFRVWARLFNPERIFDDDPGMPDATGFYFACLKGLKAPVSRLLSEQIDIEAQGGKYGNALQAASAMGHEAIVQMLLDAGADVNAQGGFYGNALQAAAIVGGQHGDILQIAFEMGHRAIVQLLLDVGATFNAQKRYFGNVFDAAFCERYYEIVKKLLRQGADANTQGGYYGNALQAAAIGGHQDIVQLLLDAGADVNAQGGLYGNALQAASFEGHDDIVKKLLRQGADANIQGGYWSGWMGRFVSEARKQEKSELEYTSFMSTVD
ncbi:Putative nucleoside phosphorylase domain, NACHT nucleoside triphosphatase [Colletotrichum destructivum]|uniref:Nucleoside phosphorylase domain, NACHT nucleoside triphosphatase n=1 Tax=Colletotrichum destructivum TaxID=34406 RepID=A0AAX4I2U5_9PEZI|nr:Putative nucleoside phosphorylase domain, NACHT nucleoside triphosphatase [Colletotrichum destructivum]